jgi:hypothetical protein
MSLSDAAKAVVRSIVAAYPADQLDRRDRSAFDQLLEALARGDDEAADVLMYERLMLKRRMSGVPLGG